MSLNILGLLSYFSSEKNLKEFEKLYKVKRLWDLGANGVKEMVVDVIDAERNELIRSLRIMAFERSFLLSLRKKYAGVKSCRKLFFHEFYFKVF